MAFHHLSAQAIQAYMKAPGGKPPHGVIPNYHDPPNTLSPGLSALNVLGLILVTSFVSIRMYTRTFVLKKLWWDDYFSALAWVLFVVFIATGYKLIDAGAGIHQWDLHYYNVVLSSYWTVIAKGVYICCILVLKISILLQILRIFVPQRRTSAILYWTITGLIVANTLFYIIEFFLAIIQCSPRARSWDKRIPGKCIGNSNIIWTAGFNVLNDILILILPMTSIWRLQMSKKRKIGVSLIFSTGFLAVVTSVLRLYYSWLVIHTDDHTYNYLVLGYCLVSECIAGIMVGCMPTVPKFSANVKEWWSTTGSHLLSGKSGSETSAGISQYQQSESKSRGYRKQMKDGAIELKDSMEELDERHIVQP